MRNIPTKSTGDTLTADEFNDIPTEMENVITDTGIALTSADLSQTSKAISNYVAGGSFYADSGTSTDYVLSTIGNKREPTALFNGLTVSFVATNINTTSTPTVTVGSLDSKNIVVNTGTPIEVGDITTEIVTTLVFDSVNDEFTYPGVFASRAKEYPTTASMEADLGLQIGQRVVLKGYDAVGDGGGKAGTVVGAATGTADGGAFHDLDNGNQFQLDFSGQIKAAWYGVLPGTTDRAARFQLLVDFCTLAGAEIILPEGATPIDSKITVGSDGVTISGGSRKECIIEADGNYTVFEHTGHLRCRDFTVKQTSGSFEGIGFGTAQSDASSAQAFHCSFDRVLVQGFAFSWWYRASLWMTWAYCHSLSTVGIRLARNADPFDEGIPDAPAGWNTFSPSIGWFHNVGTVTNVLFEDEECGLWGCPMSYTLTSCTTQGQNGDKANNVLLPVTEERTGVWLHSGTTGTKDAWSNQITSHYSEATTRPFYIQDQQFCQIYTVFSQGNTMGSPFPTPIQVNNSRVNLEGWAGQDWWVNIYILTNGAELNGKPQGAFTGSPSVDATSGAFENREQEHFSHEFSFTLAGAQTATIPVTLENESHYELHVGGLHDGTTLKNASYDIFRQTSDALTALDLRSGAESTFTTSVSSAQIEILGTTGLNLALSVTLREVTRSITQDIALTPV